MSKTRVISRFLLASTISLLPLFAFAGAADNPEPIGHMSGSGSAVNWSASGNYEKVSLRVIAPDGTVFDRDFAAGKTPSFQLQDLGKVQEGAYRYELTLTPRISDGVKQQLAAARAADDDAAAERIARAAGIGPMVTQSGTLTVRNGSFANSDTVEAPAAPEIGRAHV